MFRGSFRNAIVKKFYTLNKLKVLEDIQLTFSKMSLESSEQQIDIEIILSSSQCKSPSNIFDSIPIPSPPPAPPSLVPYLCDTDSDSNESPHENMSSCNSSTYAKTIQKCYELPQSILDQEPKINEGFCELPSSNSASLSDNFLSSIESDMTVNNRGSSILKSRKNEQLSSTIKSAVKRKGIDSEKIHNSASSPKGTPPLKRSCSVIESDTDEDESSFTPKRNVLRQSKITDRHFSWESPKNRNWYSSRKSLPGKIENEVLEDNSARTDFSRRKSFPFSKSPCHGPSPNKSFRSSETDQTPYAADTSWHKRRFRPFLPNYNASELVSLESESGFIDSHCHLDFLFQRQGYQGTYAAYQKTHSSTFPKSYKGCLAIFCDPIVFDKRYMWEKYLQEDNVWASFGCHPHNAKDYNDAVEKSLLAALEHSKVRAVGEIGLDYSNRNSCLKELQFKALRRQLKIAVKKELPVVIHMRDAHEDGMKIIKEILPTDYTIHLHCFTDTWKLAQKWLTEFPNLFIGITNVVTFPSAQSVHEVAKQIPLERLLLETDAPYFLPRTGSFKGMRWSHPGMAIHVAAQVAALKNVPIEQVLKATRENTKRMYKI